MELECLFLCLEIVTLDPPSLHYKFPIKGRQYNWYSPSMVVAHWLLCCWGLGFKLDHAENLIWDFLLYLNNSITKFFLKYTFISQLLSTSLCQHICYLSVIYVSIIYPYLSFLLLISVTYISFIYNLYLTYQFSIIYLWICHLLFIYMSLNLSFLWKPWLKHVT